MANKITMFNEFEPTAIQFSPLAKTSKGGKIVYLSCPPNDRIKIQTPVMSAPFGVSSFDDNGAGIPSYSLDASFKGHDTDERIKTFLTKCRQLDEFVLETAVQRSREWFGKQMSRDVVSEFLRKQVREASDPTKYAPTTRFKITPASEFFDEHRQEVDMKYLCKGMTFRCIVELASVWFINKNFGLTWRLVQLGVVSRPDSALTGYAFQADDMCIDDDDDDVDNGM